MDTIALIVILLFLSGIAALLAGKRTLGLVLAGTAVGITAGYVFLVGMVAAILLSR